MRIALTGGGTMGHVLPNVAVIEEFKRLSALQDKVLEIQYFGSYSGPERLVAKKNGYTFRPILCGKLRRYFSWQNFLDAFKFPIGVVQAAFYLIVKRPSVMFSKGGFVSVPACLAAWILRIPVILHESDLSPGLTNKICSHFAKEICLSFEDSKKFFPNKKVAVTGNPIRKFIVSGDKKIGHSITHLPESKPILMVMGGSQGAQQINELIWNNFNTLTKDFSILHITGKGHKRLDVKANNYLQIEYADEDLPHFYDMSDYIISRGGSNSLWEIAANNKPALIIPLMGNATRGDQVENAHLFAKKFGFLVLEGDFTNADFMKKIKLLTQTKSLKSELPLLAAQKIAKIIFSSIK